MQVRDLSLPFNGGLAQFWLEHCTVTAEVTGSSPVLIANKHFLFSDFFNALPSSGFNVSKSVFYLYAVSLSDRISRYEREEVGSTPALRAILIGE